MRVVGAILFLLIAGAPAVEAQVRGKVVDLRTGAGIADASIRVVAGDTERQVFSGPDGSYALTGLPAAAYAMFVRHPGYDVANVRLLLSPDRELVLDVPLLPQPIPLSPLLIPVSRTQTEYRPAASVEDSLLAQLEEQQAAAMRARGASPLGDLAAAEMRDPVPDPGGGEQPRALHIWGSSGERGRILVDDASINAPLHLGGILPPLDPQLLSRVALRTGGASARYDGGTSYIMDFQTRSPYGDRLSAWGELDLLVTRVGVEAPFDHGGSLLVGARRVNQEVVDALIDGTFDYDYGDVLARGQVQAGRGRSASALVLATREKIRIPRDLGFDHAAWRNFASIVSWQPEAGGQGARLSASFSRGIADLPLLSAPDGHLEATLDRSAVTAENEWTVGDVGVDAGVQLEHLRLARYSEASSDPALPDLGEPVACTPSLPCSSARTTSIAVFGDIAWQAAPSFALHAGLRTAFQTETSRMQLLPRLALTWAGRANSAATLSVGRFSQTTVSELADGTATAVPRRLEIFTEYATQLELRISHASRSLALAASAYLHRNDASAERASVATPGAELSWVLLVHGNTLSGGYSILARRATEQDSTREPQHLAFLGVGTGRGPLEFNVSAVYGAGVPLTSIVLERPTPQVAFDQPITSDTDQRGRPYVRVDATVSGTWTLRFRDRELRLTPYGRIVNAFSRRGALFYYQDGGEAELQPLSALPMMPVVGLRWIF